MLGITVSRVAEAALDYFDRELTGKQEAGYYGTGVWRGKLAERLELRGEVRREDFRALLRNEKPQGGRLTARKNTTRLQDGKRVSNRQVGYDWTFGAPKSVSIYLEAADDREMEAICHRALNRTLEKIEADMQCKVRKGGVHEDRSAPGMLMAVFEHRDARPINGIADPHRHWHCYAINCAFDPIENRFKAGQFRQLIADGGYYQEFWHAALAEELTRAGYALRETERGWKGWELACVPDEMIELFSRRHRQIDALAKEREIRSGAAEAVLAREIRQDKGTKRFKSVQAQRDNWADQGGRVWDELTPERAKSSMRVAFDINREKIVTAVFDKHSAVRARNLTAELLKQSRGKMTIEEAERFVGSPRFVQLGDHVTTPEVQAEESEMRRMAAAGRNTCEAYGHSAAIDESLSAEQAAAVKFVLQSKDRILGIQGIAGSGKSTLLREIERQLDEQVAMLVLAPTDAAVSDLRRAGFPAGTFQSFYGAYPGALVVVDEASMLSTIDMKRLLELAERDKLRILLTGDTDQHHSVQRGDAMRILLESRSIEAVELTRSRRAQVAWIREAVEDLKAGRRDEGFARLDEAGAIYQAPDPRALRKEAVEAHLSTLKAGKSSLLIAPLHRDLRKLAEEVRTELKNSGAIGREDYRIETLNRDDCKGELLVSVGDLIRTTKGFRQAGQRFRNNEILKVADVTETHLVVEDGRRIRRKDARIDQGHAITTHSSQCRTVDQAVLLADECDAKAFYVGVSRAKHELRIYTRNKTLLAANVSRDGERVSVFELIERMQKATAQARPMRVDLWAHRQAPDREVGMER